MLGNLNRARSQITSFSQLDSEEEVTEEPRQRRPGCYHSKLPRHPVTFTSPARLVMTQTMYKRCHEEHYYMYMSPWPTPMRKKWPLRELTG
ncbi:hypothetical protein RRG08_023140 [Elysia crispata]|uniref:Uncharacterized protein n=1 Tax=Elysia crispata TaxID=231223 RepID=A0AAE1CIR6_9GAST|nr:hypothetical protein RRG08_023140 [Elysia crispata]